MTEGEGQSELNEVEILNAMRNMAKMSRALYDQLLEEGFVPIDALTLVGRWIHGTAGGRTT